jgi:hypothetical protein
MTLPGGLAQSGLLRIQAYLQLWWVRVQAGKTGTMPGRAGMTRNGGKPALMIFDVYSRTSGEL